MQDSAIQKENQKKKEYLRGYIKAKKEEKRILEQIEKLRADKMFPSVQYSNMPHGTNMSDLSDYSVELDELMGKLEKERLEAVRQYKNIYRKIKAVKNERERDVLVYRYLQELDWEEVYMAMGLKRMQTHRIHGNALKNFKMG